jgi:hypothetical protein
MSSVGVTYREKVMHIILMFCAGVLLASSAIAAGEPNKLPLQFTGDWCRRDAQDKELGITYAFGHCLPTHKSNAGWLTVGTGGFAAHEVTCKLVRSVADENSNYLVQFRCNGEGETWTENYWMSLQLVMTPTDREP